jgi:hypothetical protein
MPTRRQRTELPKKGTTLTAKYQGKKCAATVVDVNVETQRVVVKYNGKTYQSLSSAAKAATGHDTNGWVFWGLENRS